MRPEVVEALANAARFRQEILSRMPTAERERLLEELLGDFFVEQWRLLLKWSALTGQSSQVDTGYLAQHVASLLLGVPGQGFKGKGLDLMDGTEVKSAAAISGVDRPRWNHNLGTLAADKKRREEGKRTIGEEYLAAPTIVYLLFDRVAESNEFVLRIRVWMLDSQADTAWRDLVVRYLESRTSSKYNLQLHPPVGYEDNLVVNTLGNLDFTAVKVMEAHIHGAAKPGEFQVEWIQRPAAHIRPIAGRSVPLSYKRDPSRMSRLSEAADVTPDLATLHQLLPYVEPAVLEQMLTAAAALDGGTNDEEVDGEATLIDEGYAPEA